MFNHPLPHRVMSTMAAMSAAVGLCASVHAQDPAASYPSKAITIIVPFAAGGNGAVDDPELFQDLPRHAPHGLLVVHDENGDGQLNRRFGMFPTEGYGLSNNPQVSGPPAFEDSAFEVAAPETAITIELRY